MIKVSQFSDNEGPLSWVSTWKIFKPMYTHVFSIHEGWDCWEPCKEDKYKTPTIFLFQMCNQKKRIVIEFHRQIGLHIVTNLL